MRRSGDNRCLLHTLSCRYYVLGSDRMVTVSGPQCTPNELFVSFSTSLLLEHVFTRRSVLPGHHILSCSGNKWSRVQINKHARTQSFPTAQAIDLAVATHVPEVMNLPVDTLSNRDPTSRKETTIMICLRVV